MNKGKIKFQTNFYDSEAELLENNEPRQTLNVGEYLDYINLVLQKTADVQILGEITSSKEYPNGIYFSLKDKNDNGVLNCFLPLYTFRGLGLPVEEGLEVKVSGLPRLVKRNGRFLFTVENMELAGEGALKKAYDLLKAKLDAEGLFSKKREMPEFITKIGIITSKAGAVIHDFKNNLDKKGYKIFLYDSRVEGASAERQICQAIEYFNKDDKYKVDIVVLMRGGGSLEDLAAFNSEKMVRAIYSSNIPTIVAIGHDKDVPLAQIAADFSASTPTAAAKIISASWEKLNNYLPMAEKQIPSLFHRSLESTKSNINANFHRISGKFSELLNLQKNKYKIFNSYLEKELVWIKFQRETVYSTRGRVLFSFNNILTTLERQISKQEQLVFNSSPERNLKLGYSIVRNTEGKVVKKSSQLQIQKPIHIQFHEGSAEGEIIKTY